MEFSTGFSGIASARSFSNSNQHPLLSITPHGIGKKAACTIVKNQSAIQEGLNILTSELSILKNFLLKKKCQLDD